MYKKFLIVSNKNPFNTEGQLLKTLIYSLMLQHMRMREEALYTLLKPLKKKKEISWSVLFLFSFIICLSDTSEIFVIRFITLEQIPVKTIMKIFL